jgi:hypothetical protein
MSVYTSNLVIHTGTDFEQTFVFESETSNSSLDLSGYTACARLKKYESSSPAQTFEIIFTNRELGKVKISMSDTATSTLKAGKYFYDLLLNSPSGTTTRVVEGTALVKKAVTRI